MSRPQKGSAEEVILMLLYVLVGDGKPLGDKGLMTRIHNGEQHLPTCQIGYCVQAGDSQRGGQPCSQRCLRAQKARDVAASWLYAHRPPAQVSHPRLFEEVAS